MFCSTDVLVSGATATFNIVVQVNTPGLITNSATVSSFATDDPNRGNNGATDTRLVE